MSEPTNLAHRLTVEELIEASDREEERFVLEALRQHYVREWERDERRRLRRAAAYAMALTLGVTLGIAAILMWARRS